MPVHPCPHAFTPTFGPPEKYFGDHQQNDLAAGLAGLLQPGKPLLADTLAALGAAAAPPPERLVLDFINYGQLQIIFRIGVHWAEQRAEFTAAVTRYEANLPIARREAGHLRELRARCPGLVLPAWGYAEGATPGGLLLAVTTSPYLPLARCIARRDGLGWGIYNPEPYYRFEPFPAGLSDDEGQPLAEACRRLIIATAVWTYDHGRGRGLAGTRASGGDFILTRDYRDEDPGALRRCWRLIAARDLIDVPFPDYLRLIREEFAVPARLEDERVRSGGLRINHKSAEAFAAATIEAGIQLGLRRPAPPG